MNTLFPLDQFPSGFEYEADALSTEEEKELISRFKQLTFQPFDFYGYKAKRRVAWFGWRYDYGERVLQDSDPIPAFLFGVRERAANFAGLAADDFAHALVTEYTPGTPIGWHRDRPVFGDVVGISLLSSCTLRFRRKVGPKWERHKLTLQPRSMYLLRGPARHEWEHSIPEVENLRYSITFRTLR